MTNLFLFRKSYQLNLNSLRASVLGANDGIISIAGLLLGIAAATNSFYFILLGGIAGIVAGIIAMSIGEYISVSSMRDSEKALLNKEKDKLRKTTKKSIAELEKVYINKGFSKKTAKKISEEICKNYAFNAHANIRLKIDPENLTNPWQAALASGLSFLAGALIPLIAISIPPSEIKVPVAFISVVIALAITGTLSAHAGGANKLKATIRVVAGGVLAMTITFTIGKLFSISGI